MRSSDSAATAAELVVTVAPLDDTGAHTADLFDWQAVMAAADGLRMYLDALNSEGQLVDADNCRIICERHEDWVAVSGASAELVSAKHPGLAFGAYTTANSLADDGGLAHLFERWITMEEKATCRLVTTAGVGNAAKGLVDAVEILQHRRLDGRPLLADNELDEPIISFGKALLKHCTGLSARWDISGDGTSESILVAKHRDQIARFLSILSFQPSIPKDWVAYAGPNMFVRPVVDKLGISVPADAVWEAVVSIFRVRMRAAGSTPTGGLPTVLAHPIGATLPKAAEMEKALAGRIITLADIDVAIRAAISFPQGFAPLPRLVRATRLAVKMEVGGCSDNAVERAEHLRTDYRELWRDRLTADPVGRAEQARLHRVLLKISDTVTSVVKSPEKPWGNALWREMEEQLELQSSTLPDYVDVDLALGGICELSSRCQVWFSDSFDVEAELERRRGKRGENP